jgi:RNA polymerase sigma-70 factor (ECF subfamily)
MTTPVEVKATPGAAPSKELEQVFMDHYDMVYRTAYRVTGNGDDAEDVLQTLFVRLLRRETMPQLERGWPAYLHRASVNISLDIIRRRGRDVSITDMEPWIRDKRPGPARQHDSAELGDRLRKALADMNPRSAQVFVLRHVEGHSNGEIARMLSTSPGSITVTLFRAHISLRKSLRSFRGGQ